jgi:OOP family OmpA-OmpF porin
MIKYKRLYFTLILFCNIAFGFSQTTYKIENNQLIIPDSLPIVFETGTSNLLPQSKGAINYVASFLISKTYISTLRIESHLANNGKENFLQKLTDQRALVIAKELAKLIDCKRLIAVGFGSTKPIANNSSFEERLKNNRSSFHIAALRSKAIGGMPLDGGGNIAGEPCANE